MMQKNYNDAQLLTKVQLLLRRIRDANLLGEGPYLDDPEVDPVTKWWAERDHTPELLDRSDDEMVTQDDLLAIWEWTGRTGRTNLQAEIAELAAGILNARNRGRSATELRNMLEELASRTPAHSKQYADLVSAIIQFEQDWSRRRSMHKEVREIYAHVGERGRETWHLFQEANSWTSSGNTTMATKLLLSLYERSSQVKYTKGIGMALLGLGNVLEVQGRYIEACKFFLVAKRVLDQVPTMLAVSAKDSLANVRALHSIPEAAYQTNATPDELIVGFKRQRALIDQSES